jgi:hypothetical protein
MGKREAGQFCINLVARNAWPYLRVDLEVLSVVVVKKNKVFC